MVVLLLLLVVVVVLVVVAAAPPAERRAFLRGGWSSDEAPVAAAFLLFLSILSLFMKHATQANSIFSCSIALFLTISSLYCFALLETFELF